MTTLDLKTFVVIKDIQQFQKHLFLKHPSFVSPFNSLIAKRILSRCENKEWKLHLVSECLSIKRKCKLAQRLWVNLVSTVLLQIMNKGWTGAWRVEWKNPVKGWLGRALDKTYSLRHLLALSFGSGTPSPRPLPTRLSPRYEHTVSISFS
jgi:hypothetical protein